MENNYDKFIGSLFPTIFSPDYRLRNYIVYYMIHAISPSYSTAEMITVSNGVVELMIHLDQSYMVICQNNREFTVNNYIVGLNDAVNKIRAKVIIPEGKLHGIMIRFTFDRVYKLLKIKVAGLSDNIISLDDIFGYQGRQLFDRLKYAPDNAKRVAILNEFFLKLLEKDKILYT